MKGSMVVGLTETEFQNETQGPSTAELRAKNARDSSAQDDMRYGLARESKFEEIIQVLAEC